MTHPRVYHPPVPMDLALQDLRAVLESPSLVLLSETSRHTDVMEELVRQSGATGNLIHDAHIAALCLEHGVTEIITGDRDFLRFKGLTGVGSVRCLIRWCEKQIPRCARDDRSATGPEFSTPARALD